MQEKIRVPWNEFDFTRLPKTTNSFRRDHKYSPLIAAFDLESTNYHNLFSFMYIWQLSIEDQTAYGRTWSDLREFLANVKAELHLSTNHKLITFDHNLKYDFGFFRKEIPIEGDLIAKSSHEIIMCTVFDCLEFRDSYNYSEKSLDQMGIDIGFSKKSGYDYSKIRHAGTELTPDELDYCCTDTEVLIEYYRREAEQYGGVSKIPLTATQRVKRIIMDRMSTDDSASKGMFWAIRKRQLNPEDPEDRETLKKLRIAFFGGYNYCTTMYKNQMLPNPILPNAQVSDWDADSHYIAQILLHKFPKDKFEPIEVPKTKKDLQDLLQKNGIYKNKAMLITFKFQKLEAKNPDMCFLPSYPKNYYDCDLKDRRSMITKKVQQMETGTMTLTDIDFGLMFRWYKIHGIIIKEVLASTYWILPDYIINTCVDLYIKKRSAKAELKRIQREEKREPTAEENAAYALIKSFLNRIYGIFVQDPVRTNYVIVDGTVRVDTRNRIRTKKTQFAPVLYQWGVWVASWARYELLTLFRALAYDRNEKTKTLKYNYRVLYSDTDSIKGFDLDTTIIAQYNEKIKSRVFDFCRKRKINFADLDGLGEFERKDYAYFKTIGQKQYAFCTDNGDFVYHISGLAQPKIQEDGTEKSYFSKFDTILEKFEALDPDMDVAPTESGLMQSNFGGEKDPELVTDYQGNILEVKVLCYVLLQPVGFKSHEDLLDLIEGTDPERRELVKEKFATAAGGAY